jgi:hypothetical protein
MIKIIVAFALLWSFLMPTIDSVITPVSSSIPAVSSSAPGSAAAGLPGQNLDKPETTVLVVLLAFLYVHCTGQLVVAFWLRQLSAIPLLLKSLLLRPLKFVSDYVSNSSFQLNSCALA